MPEEHPHFQAAYVAQLRRTFDAPEHERLGVSFRIADPVQRHIALSSRRVNIIFSIAEAMWYLSGSTDFGFIDYYAPPASGAPPAAEPRDFHHFSQSEVDSWRSMLAALQQDWVAPGTVLRIVEHDEDMPDDEDVGCTLALHYGVRDNAVHGVGYVRSANAFRGVVSDVFSFTFMLEMLATQLGLAVGGYQHQVGSCYVHESDTAWANRVLAEADSAELAPYPRMPAEDNWPYLRTVLRLEERLRADQLQLSADGLGRLELPEYWRDIVALLEIHRQLTHGTATDRDVVAGLPEVYRDLVVTRWPQLLPAPDSHVA